MEIFLKVVIEVDNLLKSTRVAWPSSKCLGDFLPCVVWNKKLPTKKLYFDGIEFPVGRHYEDEATTYKVVYRSSKIARDQNLHYIFIDSVAVVLHN